MSKRRQQTQQADAVYEGVVKWFSDEKGYGFIVPDNDIGRDEFFVHHTEISMDGRRRLRENQRVQFVITEGNKGPCAGSVVPLD